MDGMSSSLTTMLGSLASGKLGHALIGLAILIVGLVIVSFIAGFIRRMLGKVGFLQRSNLAKPLASLIKALLTIFVLMAVLQHFGLTDVLAPLKTMLNKFLAAVPNIIGAGVIGYAGWVIAKIVSELTGVALGKVDRQLALKMGDQGTQGVKLSKIGSSFIFAAILIPIAVSALGVLNIPSITEPASEMLNKLLAAIPNIIGAGIILAVTYFVAKFVVSMLTSVLDGVNINGMPQKLGLTGVFSDSFTPTKLIGNVIMFFAMLTAATAAVNTLGIEIISNIFAKVLEFGGGILVGGVILLVGYFLSTLAYNKLSQYGSAGIASIARFAILGLVLAMGLRAMGLADNIVNMAFGFTLGAVAIAAALAFGLGGREAAKRIANSWADKIQ
ncbi:mechanosensitive ion channel [Thiothrix subterranea]|uniref:Small-conductance mechanosensitive channel n=1 Tax=Thiothrix subterranea TaxID=2735563 RepID=A0AA51MIS8_9GAMM|nr:mechanosensitive ion channel [Thiothrix subterranea]MDQ5767970.1 mechanosensitive ion channel [Thiothrix subterranea]QQZ30558.1 mechanosensitive ion channel [Thiothrix subterranea]WML85264.1 mechanosensitive ion channel [Thiothrix subterranea]